MTGPDHETRPISVAELLARNGTIGAPPVGGRRRRRRGNSDAVTVAELTGEIPAIQDDEEHHDIAEPNELAAPNGTAERAELDEYGHEDYEPETGEQAHYDPGSSIAEGMRPDPVVEDRHDDVLVEEPAKDNEDDDLSAYLRSIRTPLIGATRDEHSRVEPDRGADDKPRDRGSRSGAALLPETTRPEVAGGAAPRAEVAGGAAPRAEVAGGAAPRTEELEGHELATTTQKALRAGLIVLQSIVAVAFGAGLFIAFDQLWKWNNIVALILSVLVILGLVVAVRVVRKTEDIASTLIAVAVGALVTLGPLALLQSG